MSKHQNITEDAFRFIKHRCIHCREVMDSNRLFCNKKCKSLYFEKKSKIKHGTWTNKKNQSKRRIGLQDILSDENLKDMVKEVEKNIDKLKK